MDIAWRIKEIIAQSGLSQDELAERIGVSQQYISAVAHGKKIPLDTLEKLCDVVGISVSDFFRPFSDHATIIPEYLKSFSLLCNGLSYDDIQALTVIVNRMKAIRQEHVSSLLHEVPVSDNDLIEDDGIWKPVLGDAAAGYEGVFRPADEDECVLVPKRYSSDDYYVIRAYGESMEPQIHNESCVVVHRDMPPSNGDLALIRKHGAVDHELMIKKYYCNEGTVRLVSCNRKFSDIYLLPKDIALCERVVHILNEKAQRQ